MLGLASIGCIFHEEYIKNLHLTLVKDSDLYTTTQSNKTGCKLIIDSK